MSSTICLLGNFDSTLEGAKCCENKKVMEKELRGFGVVLTFSNPRVRESIHEKV